MSINQLNFNGMTMVDVAIKRIQTFEPEEGYYLAFSGGKDSIVVKELCNMAGVKYDAYYNVTSVDPPELVKFIKEYHPDVKWNIPRYKDGSRITMWNLIPRHSMPPTRLVRYCCKELKEGGGEGRFTITGVRWDESTRRKQSRAGLEIDKGEKLRERADPDNPDNEEMVRVCPSKGKHILNPIIEWTDAEVWEFIKYYKVPYCELYDKGYTRLGCIGCPMAGREARIKELEMYPKFKQAYIRAFERMIKNQEDRVWGGNSTECYRWWIES